MNRYHTEHALGDDALTRVMRGAKLVRDLVTTTQGPRGRNIVILKKFDFEVQHDGLKVSRSIDPKDPFEKLGAYIIREAAEKQVKAVGDGTTLTIGLGYQIAEDALPLIRSGVEPMALVAGLAKGRDIMIARIREIAKPIKTQEEKVQVATVSSQDPDLGKMIGETYHKIGADGVLVADESGSHETHLEHQEGITVDHGMLSPYFITEGKTLTATVKDARILLMDRELDDWYEILPLIENELGPKGIKKLVIFAKNVSGMALASLIETKTKGLMSILCVKSPSFGKYQRDMLEDIAIMTGGTVLDEVSNKFVKDLTLDDLGYAEVVKSSFESTTILGNKGDLKKIADRVESIKMQLKNPDSPLEEEKLKERLARMQGGVYVIKTGGATEIEMKERQERVDDAIKATRAAIQGGIVPGGEVTLLEARKNLKTESIIDGYAYRILQSAVEQPFAKLRTNAGLKPDYYLAKLEDKSFGWGIDVTDLTMKDLLKAGIIDPADVPIEALRSAVSVATQLLTCGGASVMIEDE